MRLTRGQLLGGAAGGALAAAGGYALVDRLTGAPERASTVGHPPEQHVLDGVQFVVDNGVEVLVPPLHHQVVTAQLAVGESASELRAARTALEDVLRVLGRSFDVLVIVFATLAAILGLLVWLVFALVTAGISRTTSRGGLSSRTPLNAACRTSPSAVQPRKCASITILG